MDMAVVELSRLQFALTAMYHFLFVPLTLGLSFILVIMESIYVMTGRERRSDVAEFLVFAGTGFDERDGAAA